MMPQGILFRYEILVRFRLVAREFSTKIYTCIAKAGTGSTSCIARTGCAYQRLRLWLVVMLGSVSGGRWRRWDFSLTSVDIEYLSISNSHWWMGMAFAVAWITRLAKFESLSPTKKADNLHLPRKLQLKSTTFSHRIWFRESFLCCLPESAILIGKQVLNISALSCSRDNFFLVISPQKFCKSIVCDWLYVYRELSWH